MGTVPTGQLERELRKLYLQWLGGVSRQSDMGPYLEQFQRDSTKLISRLGGQAASLGAFADFPVPKTLPLSPVAGVIYDEMKQAAISASITAGLGARDAARQMFNAGLDKSYRRLERLARTETVSAYWRNQWDSTEGLGLVMVWSSEDGPRTCDYCRSRDGLVVEERTIRDHPNGRCTLIPTLPKRVVYKGTLEPDGSVSVSSIRVNQKLTPQASAGPATAEQRDPLSGKSNPAAPSKAQPVHQSAASASSTPSLPFGTARLTPDEIAAGTRRAEAQRVAMEKTRYKGRGYNSDLGWTDESNKAWTSYTEAGAKEMNHLLRDPLGYAKSPEFDQYFYDLAAKQADDLAKLIAKNQIADNIVVARGVTVAPSFNPATLKPGDMFADPAFLSTTTNLQEAADFASGRGAGADGWTFITKAPKGTNAVPGADYQSEIIFKPGQPQRVISVDPITKTVYTEMTP